MLCKGRSYQIWERNPLSVDLFTKTDVYSEDGVHSLQSVEVGLCTYHEEYKLFIG